MNRFSRLALAACTIGTLATSALAAPPAASNVPKDIAHAKRNAASLFNDPKANVFESKTGGHFAVKYSPTQFSEQKSYGERAAVEIEVTDPGLFGYYKGAAKGSKNPPAVLGNIAFERVESGHDMDSRVAKSTDIKLSRVGTTSVYRGSGTIEASTHQGDDMNVGIGNVAISVAGQKGWNSQYGKGYSIWHAPGWVAGKPAVAP